MITSKDPNPTQVQVLGGKLAASQCLRQRVSPFGPRELSESPVFAGGQRENI